MGTLDKVVMRFGQVFWNDGVEFFAGEGTSRKYPATVHGADLSGESAAAEIIDLVL